MVVSRWQNLLSIDALNRLLIMWRWCVSWPTTKDKRPTTNFACEMQNSI